LEREGRGTAGAGRENLVTRRKKLIEGSIHSRAFDESLAEKDIKGEEELVAGQMREPDVLRPHRYFGEYKSKAQG